VWCWGYNNLGQLGNAPATPGVQSNVPVQVYGITTATQIAVGYDHACALLQDRTVLCWGDNSYGQYGNNTGGTGVFGNTPQQADISDVIAISAGNNFTCALLNDSTVKCWGAGANGTLGNGVSVGAKTTPESVLSGEEGGAALTRITSINSSSDSTCGIRKSTNANQLVCWGRNTNGQRGLGNTNSSLYMKAYEVPGMTDIVSVSPGPVELTSCAISSTGTPYCFGNNDSNQAGTDHMVIDSVSGL
jgi:alpha-tubulin suppressor-like RCC1 family protein